MTSTVARPSPRTVTWRSSANAAREIGCDRSNLVKECNRREAHAHFTGPPRAGAWWWSPGSIAVRRRGGTAQEQRDSCEGCRGVRGFPPPPVLAGRARSRTP